MEPFLAIVGRDVRLAYRGDGGAGQTLMFFALTTLIFSLAVGPDRDALADLGAPVVWAAALLAAMMTVDRLFQVDAEDGSLDALALRFNPLAAMVLAKALAHWIAAAMPLLALTPILAVLLNIPASGFGPLLASLAVGTPALSLVAALVGALTFPVRRGGLLATVLTAPLFAPALIFGVDAAKAGAAADPRFAPSMLFLAAVSAIFLVIAPLAGAAAIRINLE